MTIAIKDSMDNVVYLDVVKAPLKVNQSLAGDEVDAAQYVITSILTYTDATLVEIARAKEK